VACVYQRDHTVLPATHTRTIPAFIPQPQGVTALWLVLIAPTQSLRRYERISIENRRFRSKISGRRERREVIGMGLTPTISADRPMNALKLIAPTHEGIARLS